MENKDVTKKKKERKTDHFMFRFTESDEQMLEYLSYRLDRSKSDVMRRALKYFYAAYEDLLD